MPTARDLALPSSRLVLGSYLAAHGAQKLFGSFGGYGIEATRQDSTVSDSDRAGSSPGLPGCPSLAEERW